MSKTNARTRAKAPFLGVGSVAAHKKGKRGKAAEAVEPAKSAKPMSAPSPFRVRLISALSDPRPVTKPKPGTQTVATASSYRPSPRIRRTPGVCGGAPCLGDSRIPVWILEQARRLGATVQSLVADYPTLRSEDVSYAWAFAQQHKAEIDEQIRENEAD